MVWQALGIDPTHDLIAIKKAYAGRLKVTRPDDDATAYQRLREAYEYALDYAKTVSQAGHAGAELTLPPTAIQAYKDVDVAGSTAGRTPDGAPHVMQAEPAEGTDFEADFSLPVKPHEPQARGAGASFEHPRDILKRLGERPLDQDFEESWGTVCAELDRLPLSLLPEANRLCAQFVIAADEMPRSLVEGFTDYFGWGSDFRSVRTLGSKLNLELEERLNHWNGSFARKSEIRQRYAEVLSFRHLAQQPSSFRLYFLMTLASGKVSRLWAELTRPQCTVLGFSSTQSARFNRAVKFAEWFRFSFIAVLCLVFQQVNTYPKQSWISGVLLLCLIGAGLSLAYDSALQWDTAIGENSSAKQRMYPTTKRDWFLPVWMFVGTFFSLIVEQDFRSSSPMQGTIRGLVICGVILFFSLPLIAFLSNAIALAVKPTTGATGAMLAILAICVAGASSLPGVGELQWTSVCLGVTWFLFARLAYGGYGSRIEARWLEMSENIKRQKLLGNTKGLDEFYPQLLLVVRLTLGFPYVLMHLAAGRSGRFVIAIAILTLAAVPHSLNAWRIPISMAVAGLFVLTHDVYTDFAIRASTDVRTDAWRERLRIVAFTVWLGWVFIFMRATSTILGAIHIRMLEDGLSRVWLHVVFTVLFPLVVWGLVLRVASTLAPWWRVVHFKALGPLTRYLLRIYDKNKKSQ